MGDWLAYEVPRRDGLTTCQTVEDRSQLGKTTTPAYALVALTIMSDTDDRVPSTSAPGLALVDGD